MSIAPSPALNVGTSAGLTVEAWINPANVSVERPIVEWVGGTHLWISVFTPSAGGGGSGSVFANIPSAGPVSHHVVSAPGLVMANVWQHVALTYNTNSGLATLYLNGSVVARTNLGRFAPLTSTQLLLGRRLPAPSFIGLIDEVAIYNRGLSDAEVQSIFASGAASKCQQSDCRPPPGLVSWWRADLDANDSADFNNGALANGASFAPGLVGGSAFLFDGVNDKVELGDPENLEFTNAFTIEAWIFATGLPNSHGQIFFRGDSRGCLDPYYFAMRPSGALRLHIESFGSPNCGVDLETAPLPTNQWKHVAGVFDHGTMSIFIDGALAAQTNTTLRPFRELSSGSVSIGNISGFDNSQGFNGLIDELAVYDRALSGSEIHAIFAAGTAGKCAQPSWLAVSSITGTLAPCGRTNVMLMLTTNASGLLAGTYTETVAFTNISSGHGSTTRRARLVIADGLIAFGGLSDIETIEDSPAIPVTFTIIADPNSVPPLTIAAMSSNPNVILNPIPVAYTSGNRQGTLTLSLGANGHGVSSITLVANGSPPGGGIGPATNTFLVAVRPVNDSPTLAALGPRTIDEGSTLLISDVASDVDLPQDVLHFNLPGAPAGLAIDALSRVLTWTPNESQGPGSYSITVIVSDSGSPALSATNQFNITVAEVNAPPVLVAPADRVASAGMAVSFDAAADDPDLPANALAYSLGPGAPVGASITAAGAFNWTAAAASIPNTNRIRIVVTDDGAPPLSDTREFAIVIMQAPRILSFVRSSESVTLTWAALRGMRYRVQTKATLADAEWSDLPGEITAAGDTASAADNLGLGQRFYRIEVLP